MRRRPEAAAVERVAAVDWRDVASSLDERGYATTSALLTTEQCRGLAALYDRDEAFQREYALSASDADKWAQFRARYVDITHGDYVAAMS